MADAPEKMCLQRDVDGDWGDMWWSIETDPSRSGGEVQMFVRADLVPQWLPMETAPRFEDVLVSVNAFVSIGYRKRAEDSGWFCSTTGRKLNGPPPDGWQPLPRPAAKPVEAK